MQTNQFQLLLIALDLKANLSSPTFTGTVSGIDKNNGRFGNVDNSDATNRLQLHKRFRFKSTIDSPTFTGTVSGIDKTMVGLSNVDDTSDANKPVSASVQTA
jgi:hypothetical protein